MTKHIPNILTVIRFILIPFIIIFTLKENYILSMVFLTLSGITDILDGYIARKYNFITDIGKLLDPLADKLTQISILVVLTIQSLVPIWVLIIVLIKELILIAGGLFLYNKHLVVSSKWYGKIATCFFYVAIILSMISCQFNLVKLHEICNYLYYIAIGITLFSFIMYSNKYLFKIFNRSV